MAYQLITGIVVAEGDVDFQNVNVVNSTAKFNAIQLQVVFGGLVGHAISSNMTVNASSTNIQINFRHNSLITTEFLAFGGLVGQADYNTTINASQAVFTFATNIRVQRCYVGGLIGNALSNSTTTLSTTYITLNSTSAKNLLVGGAVSFSQSSVQVTNCKTIISGQTQVSKVYSLVGRAASTNIQNTVSDDYTTASVSPSPAASCTNCYVLTNAVETGYSANLTAPLSQSQYPNLDFSAVWKLVIS